MVRNQRQYNFTAQQWRPIKAEEIIKALPWRTAVGYANSIHQMPLPQARRASKRVTITLPHSAFQLLEQRSTAEGRSLSNLAAYLIEQALQAPESN